MKNIFVLFILLGGVFESNAQVMFQKWIGNDYHDNPVSVALSNDGSYLIGGNSPDSVLNRIFLTKVDLNGDTAWTREYSGSSVQVASACAQTHDGGYFVAGSATSGLAFFLSKTDSNGIVLWSNLFDTGTEDGCWSAEETSDSGFILVGRNGITNEDIMIIKTDSSGMVVWSKLINYTNSDWASQVKQTIDGGFLITGNSSSLPTINVYLIKLSITGVVEWFKTYDLGNDFGKSVYFTSDGGYIIAGSTTGADFNVMLIKTDSLGQVMWSKTYDTGNTDYGFDVVQTPDGGYAVTGTTLFLLANPTTMLIRTDSSGNLIWSKIYTRGNNHFDNFPKLLQSNDNGFLITCQSSFGTSTGFPDMYLIKTDSMGNSGCFEVSATPVVQTVNPVANTVTPNTSIPSMITGNYSLAFNSGASVTTFCLNTNLNEEILTRNFLDVFPNPANNIISIKGNREQVKELSVVNSFGSEVLHHIPQNFETDLTIDISDLSQGIYFVSFITDSGVRYAKFIKE